MVSKNPHQKKAFIILFVALFFLLREDSYLFACRFWCAIGDEIPEALTIDELLLEKDSLKNLGATYADGWAVACFRHGGAVIFRGVGSSLADEAYDRSVKSVAPDADIILAHLRRASSGCVEGVPNPHPFRRRANGKTWLFGHNGGIPKTLLINMIGKDYLKAHPPEVCVENPPESWIDSELFFILIMKHIAHSQWDVREGLRKTLDELYRAIPEGKRHLNFFLSDGEKLWAFRRGNTLFFKHDTSLGMSSIASTPPKAQDWETFPEDSVGEFTRDHPPYFIPIDTISTKSD